MGALLVGLLAFPVLATTWMAADATCPVCGAPVRVHEVASYGTYIYQWPSRFQLVFWPSTDPHAWWSCKKCHFTAFMGHFAEPPKEKLDAIREALKHVPAPPPKQEGEAPMKWRLAAAEAVYRAEGRDDAFFAGFYRELGYWAAVEGRDAEAKAARQKALALAEGLAARKADEPSPKELAYVIGALRYLTGDAAGAERSLASVKATPAGKQTASAAKYLDKLSDDALELVRAHKPFPKGGE